MPQAFRDHCGLRAPVDLLAEKTIMSGFGRLHAATQYHQDLISKSTMETE